MKPKNPSSWKRKNPTAFRFRTWHLYLHPVSVHMVLRLQPKVTTIADSVVSLFVSSLWLNAMRNHTENSTLMSNLSRPRNVETVIWNLNWKVKQSNKYFESFKVEWHQILTDSLYISRLLVWYITHVPILELNTSLWVIKQGHHHYGDQAARRPHTICSICGRQICNPSVCGTWGSGMAAFGSSPIGSYLLPFDTWGLSLTIWLQFQRGLFDPPAWGLGRMWGFADGPIR